MDSVPYVGEEANRSPLSVIRDHQAHCLDGGLFGAAMLRRLGYPPLVIDLLPEPGTDDDHVLAIYRLDGYWGAVAKSNFVGLRYREPVFRNLRELILSFFEQFYNVDGVKTLRAYTRPLDLSRYDRLNWEWSDEHLGVIEHQFKVMHAYPLISRRMAAHLAPMDELSYRAGMLNVNMEGLYKPK